MKLLVYVVGYALAALVMFRFLTTDVSASSFMDGWRAVLAALVLPGLAKYAVQVLVAPWFGPIMSLRSRRLRGKRGGPVTPRISVIVPAWNEQVGITATVRSILRSDYPDFEVVVINDGSTDGTDAAMQGLLAEHRASGHHASVVYEAQRNGGKGSALNRGLELATGEIIFTTDADSVIARDTLRHLARQFEDPAVMSVAGNVKIGNTAGAIGLVQQLEYLYGFYFKKADALLGSVYIVGGAAAAYRRSVFDEVGRFDEQNITEDIEMSTRIQDAGHRIAYAPNAVVYTEAPVEWRGLARQRLRWKFGRLMTFVQYRHLFFSLRRRHSWFLTLLVLPAALLSEFLLLLQPLALAMLWGYTLLTSDFLPVLVYMGIVALLVTWQVFTDSRRRESLGLLLVAPIASLVFHLVDAVEFQAAVRSGWRLLTGQGVRWQRWQRRGVFAVAAEQT